MRDHERVRVTTIVAADPVTAFSIFTGEIGVWWKPRVRHLFREGRTGVMKFEPGPNGRLLEVYSDQDEPFEVGRVLTWIVGERLAFEWRQAGFRTGEITRVDVRFDAVEDGTRVTLEHHGWAAIPPESPSRHGWTGEAFASMIGVRWGDQLTFLRAYIVKKNT